MAKLLFPIGHLCDRVQFLWAEDIQLLKTWGEVAARWDVRDVQNLPKDGERLHLMENILAARRTNDKQPTALFRRATLPSKIWCWLEL